jgi:hypothetical protein
MKSNTLTTILNCVLALSLLQTVIFCLHFIFLSREVRNISSQVSGINTYRSTLQSLLNDSVAYGEKNPAINPILESVGYKPKLVPTKQPGTR